MEYIYKGDGSSAVLKNTAEGVVLKTHNNDYETQQV